MNAGNLDKLLITDFDGTITARDFYSCAVKRLLSPEDLAPWHAYTEGKITHFEALRLIFARIRAAEPEMEGVFRAMRFDPRAANAVQELRTRSWDVVAVSNGCQWYIDRLFQQHNLDIEVHANPGEYSRECGLQMRLPRESPYFSEQYGISKSDVVRAASTRYKVVAFAGDGRPDLEPALMVPPELRFARQWLAAELAERGEPFRPFEVWSEIATQLCELDL